MPRLSSFTTTHAAQQQKKGAWMDTHRPQSGAGLPYCRGAVIAASQPAPGAVLWFRAVKVARRNARVARFKAAEEYWG